MNIEEVQKSIVYETRLMRIMVLADMASGECASLAEEGYDPKIERIGDSLQRLSENIAHRVNAEREMRTAPHPAKEPGLILPFRGKK